MLCRRDTSAPPGQQVRDLVPTCSALDQLRLPRIVARQGAGHHRPAAAISTRIAAAELLHPHHAGRQLGRRGKSLLPAGVVRVEGAFSRGDPVEIAGPDGTVVARALAGYDAREAELIKGHRSDRIADLLGHPGRAALVHRDDMAF